MEPRWKRRRMDGWTEDHLEGEIPATVPELSHCERRFSRRLDGPFNHDEPLMMMSSREQGSPATRLSSPMPIDAIISSCLPSANSILLANLFSLGKLHLHLLTHIFSPSAGCFDENPNVTSNPTQQCPPRFTSPVCSMSLPSDLRIMQLRIPHVTSNSSTVPLHFYMLKIP